MKLKIRYGSGEIGLHLPDGQVLGVFRPRRATGIRNLPAAIEKSLSRPIACRRLRELVRAGRKVVIVVDDVTRPVPNERLLPPVAAELRRGGIKDRDVLILVATGLHRKLTPAEMAATLGPLRGKIRIACHDPEKNLAFLGKTSQGTRVYLNRDFLDADIKVLLGDVEFHQFCGFGGGAKSVFPGLADARGIRASHGKMERKGAEAGRIKGNPIREEIDEVGRMADVDFIVNVVLNERREAAGIFSGDMEKAFLAGARLCASIYAVDVPGRADVVIAGAGGYPRDLNLYQAQKAVESAIKIVKKGGNVILVAECREGHGSELFHRWMKAATDLEEIRRRIRKKFILGGHKAYQFVRELRQARIYLYSSIPPKIVRELHLQPLSSPAEINRLIQPGDRIAVLPQAPLTLPRLTE